AIAVIDELQSRRQGARFTQRRFRKTGRRDRERAREADGERRGRRAADRRRLFDRQGEVLGGVWHLAVCGFDIQAVVAAGTGSGLAGKRGGAIAITHEGHSRRERAGIVKRRKGKSDGRYGKLADAADGEGCAPVTQDLRGLDCANARQYDIVAIATGVTYR